MLMGNGQFPGAPGDPIVTFIVDAFFQYKFITIFSFLFGVGMGLVAERAVHKHASYGVPMARRFASLLLFGMAHGVLLWMGDIVTHYAVLGAASFWIARLVSPRVLAVLGVAALAFGMLVFVPLSAGQAAHLAEPAEAGQTLLPDGDLGADPTGPMGQFLSAAVSFDADFELALYGDGSWGRITAARGVTYSAMQLFALFLWGARTVGLFLLGMAFVRMDWFRDPSAQAGRRGFLWMLAAGLLVGVPLSIAGAILRVGELNMASALQSNSAHYLGSLLFSGGIIAAIALLVSLRQNARWTRPLAAVGRTAFSCYIAQSAIMTTLFYGYGGGLYGDLDRTSVMGIVLGVWMLELIAAPIWLRFFHAGPLEWLWRSVTYWKLQPFVRRSAA